MRFANIRNLSCVYGENEAGMGKEGVACRMDSRGICIYICPSYREIRGRRGSSNDVGERARVNVNVPTIIFDNPEAGRTLTSRTLVSIVSREGSAIEEILIERARIQWYIVDDN